MKQNAEEPDYRSMNEVQLKHELIKLEKQILVVITQFKGSPAIVRVTQPKYHELP